MELPGAPRTDERRRRRALLALLALFGATGGLAAFDIAADLREGTTVGHIAVEGAILAAGLSGALVVAAWVARLTREARRARERSIELSGRLEDSRRDAERWRREARDLLEGLGEAIAIQLDRWQLTPAEKEVAMLLLKGLSHRELAAARGVSETTARQQARAIYRKAGLAGRHDLAAFFLEDLLLPADQRG